jgi:hypothetical protein
MNTEQNKGEQHRDKAHENEHAERSSGQQGVDKAPGEEPSEDNVQFSQEAFKGKKVDADLSNEEERPGGQPSV